MDCCADAPVELASYLDEWAYVRRGAKVPEATWQRLLAVSRASDPDPWRDRLRKQLVEGRNVEALRRLADDSRCSRPGQ